MKKILFIGIIALLCTCVGAQAQIVATGGVATVEDSSGVDLVIHTPVMAAPHLLSDMSYSTVNSPVITKSLSSISGMMYYATAGPSAARPFTISGSGMLTGIRVTVSSDFEISVGTGSAFTSLSSLYITQSGGIVSPVTLYVRMKSGLAKGVYAGDITLATNGISSETITLSGEVQTAPPVLNVSTPTLYGLNYVVGAGPSTPKSFTLSGSYLVDPITITSSANYEISTAASGTFSSSLTIDPGVGTISSKAIYVRMRAGRELGTYSGSLTVGTPGATDKTVELSGSVTPMPTLTVSTSSLTGIDYVVDNGPSAIHSFNVNGSTLSGFVYVNAPSQYFEISTDGGDWFTPVSMALLSPLNGSVDMPVYVRLVPGLPLGIYSAKVTIEGTNMPTLQVSLTGEVKLTNALYDVGDNQVNVFVQAGKLVIEGTRAKDNVQVYTLMGRAVASVVSDGQALYLPLSPGSMYLVKINSSVFKVSM